MWKFFQKATLRMGGGQERRGGPKYDDSLEEQCGREWCPWEGMRW
jgi:hypothetical protein